ncbi:P-loop containing nucleoside triphosphate hydrolase protein [Aspergillus recurvatus]
MATTAKPQKEATLSDYLRTFTYARGWDLLIIPAGILASIGAGITMPLMFVVLGLLVTDFSGYFLPNSTVTQDEFQANVNRISLYVFILFIVRFVLNYINKFAFRIIGIRLSAAIRLHYFQSLFCQSVHVLDSKAPGSAAGTITTTANTLQLGISEKLGTFIEFTATIVAAMIVAFIHSWQLTLVTGSLLVFILVSTSVMMTLIRKGMIAVVISEAKAASVASEVFNGMRMIVACGAEMRTLNKFAVWADEAKKNGQRTSPLIAVQVSVSVFSMFSGFALSFWYGTKLYSDGRLSNIGSVLVVVMSVMMMAIALQRLATPLIAVSNAMLAACEFFTVIDAPKVPMDGLKEPRVSAMEDIEFRNVDFAYPSRPDVKVLDGLNLTIEVGKLTAIVGPSGSGKSTIVGLLEGWYSLREQNVLPEAVKAVEKEKKKTKKSEAAAQAADATLTSPFQPPPVQLKGEILVSGRHNLHDVDLKWWRAQIGLVQQEPFLFNDTIFNNVAAGLVGTPYENASYEVKREMVVAACEEAFASEFIDRLPEGYESMAGDSGAKLSGGQRQRISIARAVVRQPAILILDEATSAMDAKAERIVQAALDRVSRARTTISIAHRLSTIMKADKIVVLQKGKVIEEGTHHSLLEVENGVYYGLVHAQQLAMGSESADDDSLIHPDDDYSSPSQVKEEKQAIQAAPQARQPAALSQPGVRESMASFARLLYEQRAQFPQYLLIVFLSMCTGAATPIQAWLFGQIIAVFEDIYDMSALTSRANFLSKMWFVLAVCTGVLYFCVAFLSIHLAYYISSTYRKQYFENLLYQAMAFFDTEGHSPGTLTARVSSDPKKLEELLGLNMSMLYNSFFVVIGTIIITFVFGWKLALILLCVTLPLSFVAGFYRLQCELEFEKMYNAVFAESSKFASEAIGAFRTVTSLTLEHTIEARYQKLLSGHIDSAFRRALWTSFVFSISDSIGLGCQALIFWYGGRLLATHEYQLLNFFLCYMTATMGAESISQGFSFAPNMAQASAAAMRILDVRKTRNYDPNPRERQIRDHDNGIRIEIQNVYFQYPTRDMPIFQGLSLTFEAGQFVALVGASGCGKTSIISLLERFYDVHHGRILANGVDITDLNVHEYRKLVSLVAQEPYIMQGTVRDNILLGVEPDQVTEDEIHAVCRDALIHDFITSLPDGYNTSVGSKGVALSGGQKQRLSIARALIRRPRLLLLDEATSSLDSESEKLVQKAFERAASGRTMVVVAHRLATVQRADQIFVMSDGALVERGKHTELIDKRGIYWNMCQSQALDQ